MADVLVSTWADGKTLPTRYVFPPEERPGKNIVPPITLPIIDFAGSHKDMIPLIIKASAEYGCFQVINHGIEKKLMEDTMCVIKEFLELPPKEKSRYCTNSRDPMQNNKCVLYTDTVFHDKEKVQVWRDALRHFCSDPLEECMQEWPNKPTRYREIVGKYTHEVRDLEIKIMELMSKGLGLVPDYFINKLSLYSDLLVNHYPACPDPSLALGHVKHCDVGLISVLQQDHVSGLQVFINNKWGAVEPISSAFVVILGCQMQLVSNGRMKSVEHRVVTNEKEARTSIGFFYLPTNDCYIEPAKGIINEGNPAVYKGVNFEDFKKTYHASQLGTYCDPFQPYLINPQENS